MNAMFVWTIEDAFGLLVCTIAVLWFAIAQAVTYFRQKFCKHLEFYQTRECQAMCNHCGENLGSVAWLAHQKAKEQK